MNIINGLKELFTEPDRAKILAESDKLTTSISNRRLIWQLKSEIINLYVVPDQSLYTLGYNQAILDVLNLLNKTEIGE